jgi:hypothetical protein
MRVADPRAGSTGAELGQSINSLVFDQNPTTFSSVAFQAFGTPKDADGILLDPFFQYGVSWPGA